MTPLLYLFAVFLLPTTTITTTVTTKIAYITQTQTQTNQRQHFSQCFTHTLVPVYHIIWLSRYYANVLAVSFFSFLFSPLHFHCCDCHYCFTLHRQHCHWFDSCFVYTHKHLFDMQTNICSCLFCFILFCFLLTR